MILVTVGTEKYPFNRLMSWMDTLITQEYLQEEIIVQYGSCTVLPTGAKVYKTVQEDKFQSLIHQADLIISHCGEGSLLLLESLNKPYILVPRSRTFKEHVDNHQVELATALTQIDVPVAWSLADLLRFVHAPRKTAIAQFLEKSSGLVCQSLQKRLSSPLPDYSIPVFS